MGTKFRKTERKWSSKTKTEAQAKRMVNKARKHEADQYRRLYQIQILSRLFEFVRKAQVSKDDIINWIMLEIPVLQMGLTTVTREELKKCIIKSPSSVAFTLPPVSPGAMPSSRSRRSTTISSKSRT